MEFFADRMFILQFPNTFEKKVGFLDSITTEEEMSGLLNMAIAGLQRSFDQGQITNTLTKEEIIQQYAALAEPITNFAYNAFEYDITQCVEKENLFTNIFKNFLISNHISYSGTEDKFWKDLKDTLTKTGNEVDWNRRVLIDGIQKYCIHGIRIKPEYKISSEPDFPEPEEQPEPDFETDNSIVYPEPEEQPEPDLSNEIGITEEQQQEYIDNFDNEPIWRINGFNSEDEYNYYIELSEENEKSISELYENNFDHIISTKPPEQPKPIKNIL